MEGNNPLSDFSELARKSGLDNIAKSIGIPIEDHCEIILRQLLTTDEGMLSIKDRVRKLSSKNVNIPILILGETGTGKELIAQALHGDRPANTFVPINCGAIPSELLESELFGHKKGAFTGALNDKTGLIEKANKGTLFLDEIGDLPKFLQCKLLRVLQDKSYRRVGDTVETKIDFRLVSATNHVNLESDELGFRSDLYYRLAGHVIKLPPLRERAKGDITLIVTHLSKSPEISARVLLALIDNPLKGNIRELRYLIEEFNALY